MRLKKMNNYPEFMKIKKLFLFFIFVLFITGFSEAQAVIHADYQIIEDKVLVKLNFDGVSDFEFKIPSDIKALEINANNYSIGDSKNYKIIKIDSAENLEVKYITKALVDKSQNKYFFVLENPFNKTSEVKIYLPEAAILPESGVIFPKNAEITSDGRRIILKFNNFNEEQILITYESVAKNNLILYLISGLLIITLFIFYFVQKKKLKKEIARLKTKVQKKVEKKEEKLTWNLFEDEKKIVGYLLGKKNNESWTKELIKDLGISKVKLSRKLRSLEQKGIIKRIPYGNENIIRLLKNFKK